MDHVHAHFLGGKLDEGIRQGFHGTVHVTFHNHVEFLEVTNGNSAANLLQGEVLLGLDALDADELLALLGNGLGLFFVGHDVELFTGGRGTVEAQQGNRRGRTGAFYLLSTFVVHGFDAAVIGAGNNDVAHVHRAVLHQDGGQITAALVQGTFNHGAAAHFVGVGLELQQVGLEEHLLQELIYVQALLGRYFLALVLTAPVFHQDVHL